MMKKLVAMLVLMLMALPALAINEITITAVDSGSGVLSVYYNVDPASESDPVGIALSFSCSDAATTTSAGVSAIDPCFPVYLDFAHDVVGPNFDPCTWDPQNPLYEPYDGNPLAKTDEAGVPAGAVSDFSICMGRLDQPAPAKGVAHKLCDIQLAQGTAASTVVDIAADTLRGGVVGSVFTVNVPSPGTTVTFAVAKCMKETAPEYAQWVALGEPDCWCYQRQCRGDGDNSKGAFPFWVNADDLTAFRAAFNKLDAQIPAGGICSDFNHTKGTFPFRVNADDLAIFRAYFNKLDFQVPVCDMTNYNFWK